MTLEEAFMDSLMRVALEPRIDTISGVQTPSPFDSAFSRWWDNNREQIITAALGKIDIDNLASKIAERITDTLTTPESTWRKNYERESLNKATQEKLAELLAKQQLERLTSKEHEATSRG